MSRPHSNSSPSGLRARDAQHSDQCQTLLRATTTSKSASKPFAAARPLGEWRPAGWWLRPPATRTPLVACAVPLLRPVSVSGASGRSGEPVVPQPSPSNAQLQQLPVDTISSSQSPDASTAAAATATGTTTPSATASVRTDSVSSNAASSRAVASDAIQSEAIRSEALASRRVVERSREPEPGGRRDP